MTKNNFDCFFLNTVYRVVGTMNNKPDI